jgi:hypothetical protein
MPLVLQAVLLAIAYALADRFAGGGFPKLDDKLPGRAAFWGAVLAAGVGFLVAGPAGALLGLVWLAWRTPAWKLVPGSSATPRTAKEVAATFVRHAIPIPLSVPVAIWTAHDPVRFAVFMGVFALLSTVLAAGYGKITADPDADAEDAADANNILELARGAAFGLCAAGALA